MTFYQITFKNKITGKRITQRISAKEVAETRQEWKDMGAYELIGDQTDETIAKGIAMARLEW